MSFTNSNYLTISNGHIDSLISYVLDTKPYHVKLSEVVEEYLFEESVNVKMQDSKSMTIFLGADILPSSATTQNVRQRRSQSWYQDIVSDGQRKIWPVPLTSVFKNTKHFQTDKFECGVDDDVQIPGLTSGVFNQRSFEGPGLKYVKQNTNYLQESVDYFVSKGVFSFSTLNNQRWKSLTVTNVSAYPENTGELYYTAVNKSFGKVSNISKGNYEEWTIKCINDDSKQFSVVGSISGLIGTATYGTRFIHSKIEFDIGPRIIDMDPILSDGLSDSNDDDGGLISASNKQAQSTFVLTPFNKITVAQDAPNEIWSLIKTNPIVLNEKPEFTSVINRSITPALSIFTHSLDNTEHQSVWTVTFTSAHMCTISATGTSLKESYPQTLNLNNSLSFKNSDIHFSIINEDLAFVSGEAFSFSINDRVENYLVYGSISGFQQNAKIGEWYWNGKIGFKIPALDYFVETLNSTIVTSVSADNNSWNTVVSNNQILNSVVYQNGVFLTTGDHSIVGASLDGVNWTSDLTTVLTPNANEKIVLLGSNGNILVSETGAEWDIQNPGISSSFNGITVIPDLLTSYEPLSSQNSLNCIIVVGDNGTIFSSINTDGWSAHNSNVTNNLNAITWSNACIIVVGDNGTILKSEDRIVWTKVESNTFKHLNAVHYDFNSNSFIAVGQDGTILRSTDNGETWFNLGAFSDGTFNDITFGNGKYVIVGEGGWIAESTDGILWTRYFNKGLTSIAFGNGKFVGVGGRSKQLDHFIKIKNVHSMAEPSVYTVTFVSSEYATVKNNLYGYKQGLKPNEIWDDGLVSFKLESFENVFEYQSGDVVKIHLTPFITYNGAGFYDQSPYENFLYDSQDITDISVPTLFNEQLFPLFHSNGSVIIKNCNLGDTIYINKLYTDSVRFKINGSTSLFPELGAVDDWLPLEFRYYSTTETEVFPELAVNIQCYLGSNPDQKVFTIEQPQHLQTDRNASAILTFDQTFFSKYLKFNTRYSLLFIPEQSYGQKVNIKISEDLRTYARIRLNFNDVVLSSIVDSPIDHFHIITDMEFIDTVNVSFIEGGAIPINTGYEFYPYDTVDYDLSLNTVVLLGFKEITPGNYIWTGEQGDWLIPKKIEDTPGVLVSEKPDMEQASTSFNEGLTIVMRHTATPNIIDSLSATYKSVDSPLVINLAAQSYLITHDFVGTPSLIVESLNNPGVFGNPIPNLNVYDGNPSIMSSKSFTFSLPNGFTAPFKLTLV